MKKNILQKEADTQHQIAMEAQKDILRAQEFAERAEIELAKCKARK